MKNNSPQQEVLLLTNTRFASRQYAEKENGMPGSNFNNRQKLENACWSGLLKEMLPEIFVLNKWSEKLYLWQVREANQFFTLEMSEYPVMMEDELSIDPYHFMALQEFN